MDDSIFLPLDNKRGETPKRIQLLPPGPDIKGRDGRRYVLKDAEAVAKASNSWLPSHSIDENHAVDLKAPRGEASPAFGWFSNVAAEANGSVWADVEWTERGKAAVSNLEYKYLSPVFLYAENGEITSILRAALSNNPNLDLKSLNTVQTPAEPAKELQNMNIAVILAALGLPETATEEEALAAISALRASLNAARGKNGQVDLSAYAPRADVAAMESRALAAEKQLAELNAAYLRKETEAVVDQAVKDRKIAPASRDLYVSLCSTRESLEGVKKALAASPAVFADDSQVPAGSPPPARTSLNAEEISMAKAMGYSEEEWKRLKEVTR